MTMIMMLMIRGTGERRWKERRYGTSLEGRWPQGLQSSPLIYNLKSWNKNRINKFCSLRKKKWSDNEQTSSNKIREAAFEDKFEHDSLSSLICCDGCLRMDLPFPLDSTFFFSFMAPSFFLFPFLLALVSDTLVFFCKKALRGPVEGGELFTGLSKRPAKEDWGAGPLLLITRCDWVASSSCDMICLPERLEELLTSNT